MNKNRFGQACMKLLPIISLMSITHLRLVRTEGHPNLSGPTSEATGTRAVCFRARPPLQEQAVVI